MSNDGGGSVDGPGTRGGILVALAGDSWWFVLKHAAAGDGGAVSCPRDGQIWTLQMPVTDGLVAMPQMLMCTACMCAPYIVYSGPTPPSTEDDLRRGDGVHPV